jgi:hypothetical protein
VDFGANAHGPWHTQNASWSLPDRAAPGGWSLAHRPLSQLPGSPPQRWSIYGSLAVGAEVLGIRWSGRPSSAHSDGSPDRTVQLFVTFVKRHSGASTPHGTLPRHH